MITSILRKVSGISLIALLFLVISYFQTGSIMMGVAGILFILGILLLMLVVGTAVYLIVS